ncbi:hypothetical protein [Streptomyces sp. NPDC046261]|uniref:hypothetical protein n=1 Tax=Streptomyces sp. NPDC046261 TaxID=3157200 RepID=UPI0033E742FE
MSKRQKGRRHRRVNRTPRPVGSTRPSAARHEPRPESRHEPRPHTGLGRHEARTFDGLRALGDGGASVDELCAAVGYQARTIVKHVNGLAQHGLVELRGERWYATEGQPASR